MGDRLLVAQDGQSSGIESLRALFAAERAQGTTGASAQNDPAEPWLRPLANRAGQPIELTVLSSELTRLGES